MFIHFESPIPASLYHVELSIGSDGHLDVVSYDPVDFTAWGGLWTPCAGACVRRGTWPHTPAWQRPRCNATGCNAPASLRYRHPPRDTWHVGVREAPTDPSGASSPHGPRPRLWS